MVSRVIKINKYYGSLSGMLNKYEKHSRKDYFKGETLAELQKWQTETREKLKVLLGWHNMDSCDLMARQEEKCIVDDGIVREKVIIQVEPETWMPMYILIPPAAAEMVSKGEKPDCYICLPGHQGGGKYSVAGCTEIPAIKDKIELFHYDYGMQLAKRGYVTICPDSRGFGERRDEALQIEDDEDAFLKGTCYNLARMAEPLGETVAGMCAWDAARLIDYIYQRNEWNTDTLGVAGFSGGGMQTLWIAALDERVRKAIISGYMYGYRDALLILNWNCSCNYVPHLWEHYDMGDVAALIAPRPLIIQSCRDDILNGHRGLDNVYEQVEIIRKAYSIYEEKRYPIHDIREGGHCWHEEVLDAEK